MPHAKESLTMEKTHFSMVLVNKKGELARLGELLGEAKVNIEALSISEGVHTGVVKFVVDEPDRARVALEAQKLEFSEDRVVAMMLPNRSGALAEICRKVAEEGFSINSVYGSTCSEGCNCHAQLMVSVADAEALEKLKDLGLLPSG